MADNTILLSICIPTRNRGAVLRETLESITAQEAFLNGSEVEVVISDNDSTDDTAVVGQEYANRFPGKVIFFRQSSNTFGDNFCHALMLGRGLYSKLHNDTLLIRPGALRPFLDMLREVADKRPVIALTNGNRVRDGKEQFEVCHNLDELVGNVSFFLTWIGGMGLWREDIGLAKAFLNDSSQLAQVDIQCGLVASGRPALALFDTYFVSKQDHRGRFNWTRVFGKNYLNILKKYVAANHLSMSAYAQAKQEVLLRHILPNYFNTKNVYDKTDFFANLDDYRDDGYFYQVIADHLPGVWRLSNPHNQIAFGSASSPQVLARVSAGANGRGVLNVRGPLQSRSTLEIGRFATIGENVMFFVGEPQPKGDAFSNYWAALQEEMAGSISIGDDVWIGGGAQIMSGISVGQGAIIGPGSVVMEDVPPYSHVSGVPARVVAYRFELEVVEKLCAFDFSCLTSPVIERMGPKLLALITRDNVDTFLTVLRHAGTSETMAPAPVPSAIEQQRVPAVLILDGEGAVDKVETSLVALANGPQRELPVIVLTVQEGALPQWTDSLRYVQTRAEDFVESVAQLRELPDFDWVNIIEAGH